MIKRNTTKYIDVLQNIVGSYNRTIHAAIGIRPFDVNKSNQFQVFQHIKSLKKPYKVKPYKFNVKDTVAIEIARSPFDTEFSERFTRETFKIARFY